MKNTFRSVAVLIALFSAVGSFAGNPDRAGSASGLQLLVNPWAKGSGLANAGTASAVGSEATFYNVAGLAFTKKTELIFTHTNYLSGAGISLNAFGFSQKVGEAGVLALTLANFSFGEEDITTEDMPEGGIGTFSPTCTNIGLSYAKTFSNHIYGGFTLRLISERMSNAGGSGIAFDAGIRYVTGKKEHIRLGIALKNVGPPIRYKGDGLSRQVIIQDDDNLTLAQRAEGAELPALLNIGGAYDFFMGEDNHIVTAHLNFTSNSFKKDEFMGALEYSYKRVFNIRMGYRAEASPEGTEVMTSAWTGLAGGAGFSLPFGKEKSSSLSFDYSYRHTSPFNGIHSFGARLNL